MRPGVAAVHGWPIPIQTAPRRNNRNPASRSQHQSGRERIRSGAVLCIMPCKPPFPLNLSREQPHGEVSSLGPSQQPALASSTDACPAATTESGARNSIQPRREARYQPVDTFLESSSACFSTRTRCSGSNGASAMRTYPSAACSSVGTDAPRKIVSAVLTITPPPPKKVARRPQPTPADQHLKTHPPELSRISGIRNRPDVSMLPGSMLASPEVSDGAGVDSAAASTERGVFGSTPSCAATVAA